MVKVNLKGMKIHDSTAFVTINPFRAGKIILSDYYT